MSARRNLKNAGALATGSVTQLALFEMLAGLVTAFHCAPGPTPGADSRTNPAANEGHVKVTSCEEAETERLSGIASPLGPPW